MIDFKELARQLRQPQGDFGKQVGLNMNRGNALMNKIALESLDPEPNDHVLEIGMGNGAFIRDLFLVEDSITYTGCDFSETMIKEATDNNPDLVSAGQVKFTLASSGHLPFAEASFNKIFTVNTLYFWERPEDDLREIKKVLKDNGILILAIRPASVMKDLPFTQYGFKLYEKEDVETLLTQNGFIIKEIKELNEEDQQMGEMIVKMRSIVIIAGVRSNENTSYEQ